MSTGRLALRDNRGATIDRYTFIIMENNTKYFYSFSENPRAPLGIDNYCGSSEDGLEDGDHLGGVIHFIDIPSAVRDAIFARYSENREKIITEMKAKILKFESLPKSQHSRDELRAHKDLLDALEEILSA